MQVFCAFVSFLAASKRFGEIWGGGKFALLYKLTLGNNRLNFGYGLSTWRFMQVAMPISIFAVMSTSETILTTSEPEVSFTQNHQSKTQTRTHPHLQTIANELLL